MSNGTDDRLVVMMLWKLYKLSLIRMTLSILKSVPSGNLSPPRSARSTNRPVSLSNDYMLARRGREVFTTMEPSATAMLRMKSQLHRSSKDQMRRSF
jgi:hypothetical protein